MTGSELIVRPLATMLYRGNNGRASFIYTFDKDMAHVSQKSTYAGMLSSIHRSVEG